MRDMLGIRHHVDQLVACVLGMAGHKAQDKVALDLVKLIKQIGKIVAHALGIGIDVLPEQRDILISLFHKILDLGHHLVHLATALSAAHVGHDAIGAEIVTAVHDGHPGAVIALAADRHALGHRVFSLLGAENAARA